MKFELFGKLRDSGNEEMNNEQQQYQEYQESDMSSFGGGLEDTVEQMFSQGYSESDIRQELQGQYKPEEIDQAINRTVTTSAASTDSEGPEPMTPYQGEQEAVSPMDEGFDGQGQQEPMNQQPQNPGQMQEPAPQPMENPAQNQNSPQPDQNVPQGNVNSSVEQLVETIVAENFERVEEEFENAYTEIDDLKQRVDEMEQRVHDLEVRDDEDQQEFVQKVDEMEEHLDQYQSRIGGLEKAFQQVLPSLVDNVRDLTSLVQELKQERGIETETNVSEDDIKDMNMDDW